MHDHSHEIHELMNAIATVLAYNSSSVFFDRRTLLDASAKLAKSYKLCEDNQFNNFKNDVAGFCNRILNPSKTGYFDVTQNINALVSSYT